MHCIDHDAEHEEHDTREDTGGDEDGSVDSSKLHEPEVHFLRFTDSRDRHSMSVHWVYLFNGLRREHLRWRAEVSSEFVGEIFIIASHREEEVNGEHCDEDRERNGYHSESLMIEEAVHHFSDELQYDDQVDERVSFIQQYTHIFQVTQCRVHLWEIILVPLHEGEGLPLARVQRDDEWQIEQVRTCDHWFAVNDDQIAHDHTDGLKDEETREDE